MGYSQKLGFWTYFDPEILFFDFVFSLTFYEGKYDFNFQDENSNLYPHYLTQSNINCNFCIGPKFSIISDAVYEKYHRHIVFAFYILYTFHRAQQLVKAIYFRCDFPKGWLRSIAAIAFQTLTNNYPYIIYTLSLYSGFTNTTIWSECASLIIFPHWT